MLKCKSCGVDHKDGYDYGLPCVECIMSTQQARIAELEAKLLDAEQVMADRIELTDRKQDANELLAVRVMALEGTLGRVKASVERFCCIPHRKTKPHACTPMDVSDVESLRSLLSGVPEVLAVVEGYLPVDIDHDYLWDGSGGLCVKKTDEVLSNPLPVVVTICAKHIDTNNG